MKFLLGTDSLRAEHDAYYSYYFFHSFETLFRENRFRQHGYLSIGIDPRVLFFLSILPLSRGDRISYRRVGRVERKNGKHRMVGNVARWNVSHPGEERGEGLGRKDQHSRCNPVSHRLVIPSHTCSPSHHLLRPFSGSCSPAFHRPLRHPFLVFHLCYGTRKSIFVYLFIYFPSSYEDTKTKAGKKVQFPNKRRSACVEDRSLSSRMKNIFLSTIV